MDSKPRFRNAFRDHLHELGLQLDSMKDTDRSKHLARFYVSEILRRLQPGLLPDDPEDLESAVVDGPGDCGVDFILRRDSHVLIIQAKYRASKRAEPDADFSHFSIVLSRLHPSVGAGHRKSDRLKMALADLDWDRDTFQLEYVTLGAPTNGILQAEVRGAPPLQGMTDAEDRVDLTFIGEDRLNDLYRDALSAGERVKTKVAVLFSPTLEGTPWVTYRNSDDRPCYIGLINAGQLRQLYQQHRNRLFSLNIRNYVGDTSTNKGIRETAVGAPENFFFFNNGISAVATRIDPDASSRTLVCQDFAVINGAQTVRSLAKAHGQEPGEAKKAEVLIRVSEISLAKEQGDFLDAITRYNNTQNAIKIADFRSNDPIQIALSKRFAKLSRGGKTFWYKNKRTSEADPSKIAIGMEEFAKTIHAFQYCPHDFIGGSDYLFSTDSQGGYVRVFGDGQEIWQDLAADEFDRLAGTWFLCEEARTGLRQEVLRQVDSEGKAGTMPPIAKAALERRWMVFFAVGELLRAKYRLAGRELDADVRKLGRPKWMEANTPVRASIAEYVTSACELLIKVYRASLKASGFLHRNWFRDEATLSAIREEIRLSSTLLKSLPFLSRTVSDAQL